MSSVREYEEEEFIKILVFAAIAFVVCLLVGVREQTQFRKQRIRHLAERIGKSNLFN